MRLRQLFLALLLLLSAGTARAATTVTVTAQGASAYLFNGANPNGTLTLIRGQTYVFQVNATGHPFHITTAPGLPPQDLVDAGLANNGVDSGTVTFTPSAATSSASLFYQCGVHTAMTGRINLVAAGQAIPATGLLTSGLLAALVIAIGLIFLRKARRAA